MSKDNLVAMLQRDLDRLEIAGGELAEAAARVAREYDGVHRLSLAIASWHKARADCGDRGQSPGLGWQPIETAPKDGTPFVTYMPTDEDSEPDDCYDIAYWSDAWGAFCKAGCGFRFVTHWKPLQPPE